MTLNIVIIIVNIRIQISIYIYQNVFQSNLLDIARPACHRELRLANISSITLPTAGGWCFSFTLLQGLNLPPSLKYCREEIHQILIVVQILILLPNIIVNWANPLSYM